MPKESKSGFYLEGAPFWYDISPLPDDIPFPIPSDYIDTALPCPVDVYVSRAVARSDRRRAVVDFLRAFLCPAAVSPVSSDFKLALLLVLFGFLFAFFLPSSVGCVVLIIMFGFYIFKYKQIYVYLFRAFSRSVARGYSGKLPIFNP